MVSGLIHYSDTCKFYGDHIEEIGELLTEVFERSGVFEMSDIFGDQWDHYDPLCLNTQNQNLLAWFSYEETARRIQETL